MLPDDPVADLETGDESDEPEDLEDLDDDEEDAALALAGDDDDEEDDASLDELLAQRATVKTGPDEAEDADDIMALASEPDLPPLEPLPTNVTPIRDRAEFVCNNCHLVKAKVQLADEARGLCRDCV